MWDITVVNKKCGFRRGNAGIKSGLGGWKTYSLHCAAALRTLIMLEGDVNVQKKIQKKLDKSNNTCYSFKRYKQTFA